LPVIIPKPRSAVGAAEFIEFCIGCRVALPAALIELMKLRR